MTPRATRPSNCLNLAESLMEQQEMIDWSEQNGDIIVIYCYSIISSPKLKSLEYLAPLGLHYKYQEEPFALVD